MSLPQVNLDAFLNGSTADQQQIAQTVDEICSTIGFLVVEGHGVDANVINDAWQQAATFFALPESEKRKSESPDPECPRGYFPSSREALAQSLGEQTPPDLKESLAIGPMRPPEGSVSDDNFDFHFGPNLWPEQPPQLRTALTRYIEAMEALGGRVLELFAAALNLPHDYFERFHTSPRGALRCLRYPAWTQPLLPGQRGAGEHSDYGSITILKSDPTVPGLEVRRPGGEWIQAPLIDDGFIINIGDMMARWTNDRWVSTLHRVTCPANAPKRHSIAFFHNANYDAKIECIPTCLADGEQAKYKPVTAGDYLMGRFKSALAAE
ncbi:MAG: 2-oxoglutarate and iron-dependent oxygenase domain-containing protein [Pseudomonadota bacterium]